MITLENRLDIRCLRAHLVVANVDGTDKVGSDFLVIFWIKNSTLHYKIGGDGRNRTGDPLLAKQVLYHLSYIPTYNE